MQFVHILLRAQRRVQATATQIAWVPLLLVRLTLGVVFEATGLGKIHNLDKVTNFFRELGIPAPGFNAALVAGSEFFCGSLLLVGLLSRVAALPLMVTMVVALATAKRADIHGLVDLTGTIEFTYLVLLVTIAILGPGAASFDETISRRWKRNQTTGL